MRNLINHQTFWQWCKKYGVAFLWDGIGATVGLGDLGTWGLGDLGTSRIPEFPISRIPYLPTFLNHPSAMQRQKY